MREDFLGHLRHSAGRALRTGEVGDTEMICVNRPNLSVVNRLNLSVGGAGEGQTGHRRKQEVSAQEIAYLSGFTVVSHLNPPKIPGAS